MGDKLSGSDPVKVIAIAPEDAPTVPQSCNFFEFLDEMMSGGIGCCFFVGDQGEFLGVLTDGDVRRVLKKYGPLNLFTIRIFGEASTTPITCSPETTQHEALKMMEFSRTPVSCLPLLDSDKKFLGVVTMHGILRSFLGSSAIQSL